MPADGSVDDPESSSVGGVRAFWTSLPGVLTGVAAVIAALVSLLALWHPAGGSGTPTATRREPSGASVAATDSESGAPAVSAPAASPVTPAAGGVVARGALSMRTPDGADLVGGRVGNAVHGDVYLECAGGRCVLVSMGGGLVVRR